MLWLFDLFVGFGGFTLFGGFWFRIDLLGMFDSGIGFCLYYWLRWVGCLL